MDIKLYIKDPDSKRGAEITLLAEGMYQTVALGGMDYHVAVRIAPEAPADRLLTDILRDAISHGSDYPNHGVNCACMDKFIREVQNQIRSVVPSDRNETWGERHRRWDALSRVRWVLGTILRGL